MNVLRHALADVLAASVAAAARESGAGVYAALGDKDQAFACLEKAYETHDFFLAFLKVHPFMDPLRGDRRFAALTQRLHLPL